MAGIRAKKWEVKLDSVKRKTSAFGHAFTEGFKTGMKSEWTTTLAAGSGLYQGLKYKGSLKKGLITAGVVKVCLATKDGIQSVANHWDDIKHA